MIPTEMCLDVFQFIELNEVEKCQLVSRRWRDIVAAEKEGSLNKARRIISAQLRNANFAAFLRIQEEPVIFCFYIYVIIVKYIS